MCALTGCAAVLLECGARTVHSWAGIGLASGETDRVIDRVCRNKFKKMAWAKADLLIVDEISMMSKKLFDILDGIGRKARRNRSKPFGGMQVMFSGDFYQLPPVGDRDEPDTCAFCFESRAWNTVFPEVIELKKIYRQSDATYVKMLNQIRRGKLSRKSYALLQDRVCRPPPDTGLVATQLVPRRREADAINRTAMQQLEGEIRVYTMRRAKDVPISKGSKADSNEPIDTSPTAQEAEVGRLKENLMVGDRLELKIGAQVMCVANIEMEGPKPIVNGSQGIVREFRDGLPVVQFRDGQTHVMGRHIWPSETMPGVGVEQVPLIQAWAITIHKAQGVTLDMAEIDAGSGVFECGQTYVALSRVKSLAGLYLTSLDPGRIRVNRKVQEFYANLVEGTQTPLQASASPPTPVPVAPPRPVRYAHRGWSADDDAMLWQASMTNDDKVLASEQHQVEMQRSRGAILSRLKHLRDPSHRAYQRLHEKKTVNGVVALSRAQALLAQLAMGAPSRTTLPLESDWKTSADARLRINRRASQTPS